MSTLESRIDHPARIEYARKPNARDRVLHLLTALHQGSCPACGHLRYWTRSDARYAARLARPGVHLRRWRCGRFWHNGLSWPSAASGHRVTDDVQRGGGADARRVTARRRAGQAGQRIVLDGTARAERACGRPTTVRPTSGTTTNATTTATCGAVVTTVGRTGGRGATDPLGDARDTDQPANAPGRSPRRPGADPGSRRGRGGR